MRTMREWRTHTRTQTRRAARYGHFFLNTCGLALVSLCLLFMRHIGALADAAAVYVSQETRRHAHTRTHNRRSSPVTPAQQTHTEH